MGENIKGDIYLLNQDSESCDDSENDDYHKIQRPSALQNEQPSTSGKNQMPLDPIQNDIKVDVTCEFLEVAFQQILYHRGVYPKEVFSPRKIYGVPVNMCIFPKLSKYIFEVIKSLKPSITQNAVKKVVLSILCDGKSVEKFVIELGTISAKAQKIEDKGLVDLELCLRECLLRIAAYEAPPLKQSSVNSFEVTAHVRGEPAIDLIYENESKLNWVKAGCRSASKEQLTPLKTVKDNPFIDMRMFVLHQ